ncbi:Hypothetical protein Tpal_2266 [Trichococcus palustris]|uniref:Uncharacterized protein n=1 Tax=Trichococcus palustris TaxID=140314 RepID=A0A143YUD2_9LACT|nr:Hypothetical protein Tpal_2266 [Trichococcus palustris]SFK94812.1 hypothetical protein SAMN04488076_11053 [Trichococcus palustris]
MGLFRKSAEIYNASNGDVIDLGGIKNPMFAGGIQDANTVTVKMKKYLNYHSARKVRRHV